MFWDLPIRRTIFDSFVNNSQLHVIWLICRDRIQGCHFFPIHTLEGRDRSPLRTVHSSCCGRGQRAIASILFWLNTSPSQRCYPCKLCYPDAGRRKTCHALCRRTFLNESLPRNTLSITGAPYFCFTRGRGAVDIRCTKKKSNEYQIIILMNCCTI